MGIMPRLLALRHLVKCQEFSTLSTEQLKDLDIDREQAVVVRKNNDDRCCGVTMLMEPRGLFWELC